MTAWPASEEELATVAQLISEWWGELGIGVEAGVTEDETLTIDITPPEYDPPGLADAPSSTLWGWVGDVDPSSAARPVHDRRDRWVQRHVFPQIPRFDELFVEQGKTLNQAERKAMLQEMQEIFYKELPNIPLYYDSELHAYRTDRFGGWQNQPPANGTPLFGFGPIGYTMLTDATGATGSGDNTGMVIGLGATGAVLGRRRRWRVAAHAPPPWRRGGGGVTQPPAEHRVIQEGPTRVLPSPG